MNNIINSLYKYVPCHRHPSRCLTLNGEKLKICSRCLAIYPMYLFYPLTLFFVTDDLIWLLIGSLLCVPLVIDGFTQKWKWRKSNTFLRIFTGILFGLGQIVIIAFIFKFIITII